MTAVANPTPPPATAAGHRPDPVRDPRLEPVDWHLPTQRAARRRVALVAVTCTALAIWYLAWLLQGRRVGNPELFGLLVAAEVFNLAQAAGFWWTCARQRVRAGRAPASATIAVDVLIPVYDEPVPIVEPTVAAAVAMRGADHEVWLLDDGRRPELRELAEAHGARYLTRADCNGAKAGNLNHALGVSHAPFVVVLDCDHVPHVDLLERTLGHLDDPQVAMVQTPQYYANTSRSAIAAAASAQQRLFFGPIARGKDGLGAMFCCGTNFVFRRSALEDAGGFPEHSLTEDFELSIAVHERGWRTVYLSEVVASGLGPEDMASYISQQQRWARGCISAIPRVLRARLPWRTRVQYLLSTAYFLSGWTLLLYMALPVVRLLFGIQPLARITANQFLLHFAPYYCGALAAVALAGAGGYTFGAFALSASSFWIHVQATVGALLRLPARFVVTPKLGSVKRQPRAVWPALVALVILVGAAAVGLVHSRGPATLNNVAFAMLHSTVLIAGVLPALWVRRSIRLAPAPGVRAPVRRRRWSRPAFATLLCATMLVPVAIALLGAKELALPATLSQKAHTTAEAFLARYVTSDGRVVRRDQGGDTVSEGQAYAMLVSVALDDQTEFQRLWHWTRTHLQLTDGLLASHWQGGAVVDPRPAADADLDAASALALAAQRFSSAAYERDAATVARAVLEHETVASGSSTVLVAGPWARTDPAIVNPSYFSPRAYANLAHVARDPRWRELAASSRKLVAGLIAGGRALPPDWAALPRTTLAANPVGSPGVNAPGGPSPVSAFDAVRVAIRYAASCVPADRRLAASLWPLYRATPGRDAYSLSGTPLTSWKSPASFVAGAASAQAAGHAAAAARLLDRAQEQNTAHPTYYGAAWVALGRIELTSDALGGCTG